MAKFQYYLVEVRIAISPADADALLAKAQALPDIIAEMPAEGIVRIRGVDEQKLKSALTSLKAAHFTFTESSMSPVYREKITQICQAVHVHKLQKGGAGEFAAITLRCEPLASEDIQFENVTSDLGAEFVRGVREGASEFVTNGPVAGFPLIGIKIVLLDGKYHEIDSSYETFRIAAKAALEKAIHYGQPILLEPLMKVVVSVPETVLGSVIGDINARRGTIESMETLRSDTALNSITAIVPLRNLFAYGETLSALTEGEGTFESCFDRYEPVLDDFDPDPKFPQAAAMRVA